LDVIIATLAGFVSFISPCVLPLVPAYIGYMGGRVTHTVAAQVTVGPGGNASPVTSSAAVRFNTGLHGVSFVLGFTFVFVTLGILGTAFVQQVGSTATVEGMIGRIGGIFIIFFGLHFMGAIPAAFRWLRSHPALISSAVTSVFIAVVASLIIVWAFAGRIAIWDNTDPFYPAWTGSLALVALAASLLGMFLGGAFSRPAEFWNRLLNTIESALYADTRRQMSSDASKGLSGSALMGVVFAAGWTPCIGPTLGLAMTMAVNSIDIPRAALMMTAYSLGMGIPFIMTALMLDSAQGGLRRLNRHMGTIKLATGAFLLVIGVTIASGRLQDLSRQFSVQFGDFSYRVEQCTIGLAQGEIGLAQYGICMTGEEDFTALRRENGQRAGGESTSAPAVDINSAASIESAAEAAGPAVGLAVGNRAPDFQTTTIDGQPVSLSDMRGNVVLVNFWYTYCAPCRIEMPEFEEVYNQYSDQGFTILAVNREEDAATIAAFADDLGLTFPLLLDETADIQFLYRVLAYPSTFIIDRDGIIRHHTFGALTADLIHSLVADALS
jgi:cytochrome c-type biogenesis protein